MKRYTILITIVFLAMGWFTQVEASPRYTLDEAAVDHLFATSEQMDALSSLNGVFGASTAFQSSDHGKQPAVAFALAWVLGPLGVHRFYLGTSAGTGIGYILTFGGCGIVATIDWIMLLIEVIDENNFENYVNNPRFFMWTN